MARRPLRFGSGTLQKFAWHELVERWRMLADLGFDTLWLTDHIANPDAPHDDWFDGWTALTGLAHVAPRVRLGILVTNITYRNPTVLAREALTLDHITDGRLELAIGPGGQESDHLITGVPYWRPSERVARFREFTHLVDALLRHEQTTFAGKYYAATGAMLRPRPVQQPRPPLTIAAHGPATLAVAARYGDTWNSLGGMREGDPRAALDATRHRIEQLVAACQRIGRDPAELRYSFLAGFTPDRPFDSIDACVDFIGRYAELGISEFVFFYRPRGVSHNQFERVIGGALPQFRNEE